MPSTKVELAWAVQVKVHKLGASLEAYHRLKPTITTVRLCNRFGHGERAKINKLPVELVHNIESLLMQQERAKTLPEWLRDFRCWSSKCEMVDHVPDEEILEIYNNVIEDLPADACCARCRNRDLKFDTVTGTVRTWMEEFLDVQASEGYQDLWITEHDSRANAWCDRVGKPTSSSRGQFDVLAKVLEKDFGLQVWISHMQLEGVDDVAHKSVAQSTKAYLRLPESSTTEQEWEPVVADYDYDPQRELTESGSASTVAIPRAPSKASLSRFERARKILGLQTVPNAAAPPGKPAAVTEVHTTHGSSTGRSKSRSKPKLTMFIQNCDKSQW